MREKEIETDYRFMPESNLPPVHIKQEWIENCRRILSKPRYLKNIEEYDMEPEVALQIAVSYYSTSTGNRAIISNFERM